MAAIHRRLAQVARLAVLVALFLPLFGVAPPRAGAAPPPSTAAPNAGQTTATTQASGAAPAVRALRPAEVPALRTRTSRTYKLGNGAYQAVVAAGSLNYQDATGAWQPIDDTLVPDPTNPGGYVNRANRYQVHLPPTLAAPVRVAAGGASLSFGLAGAGGTLSVSGATATYADALPGVTVAYTAGNDGLEETLTLASAAAPATFTYTLSTSGVAAKADAAGGVDFLDGAGKAAFSFAPPTLADRAQATAPTASVRLALGRSGAGQTVTVSADPAWLADPARAYPVTLDPTIVFKGASQVCYIASGGTITTLCGANFKAGYDGKYYYHSLFQFDVQNVIPANVTVLNAQLALVKGSQSQPVATPLAVYPVTRAWTTGVTWATADGSTPWTTPGGDTGPTPVGAFTATSTGTTYDVYPTTLVQGWVAGTTANDGLLLREPTEDVNDVVIFSDTATAFTLTVVYAPWLGTRGFSPLVGGGLTDRTDLQVNAANGNLMLHATDLAIAGTGLPLVVDRTFNNLSSVSGDLGNLWTMGTGDDIGLQLFGDGSAGFYAPGGTAVPYFRNPDGSFATPPGVDAALVQNGGGTYTLTFQRTGVRYDFTSGGYLADVTDRNGNSVRFAYDGYGRLTSVTDTQGRRLTLAYNAGLDPRVISMTDSSGRTARYTYAGSNYNIASEDDLLTYTDPAGKQTKYAYDSNFDLTQVTDPAGLVTKMAYDGSYRVTAITYGYGSPVAATYSFAYNSGNTVVTDPNSHQATYSFDISGRVTKVTDALGNSQQWSWTADDQVQTSTDGYGKVTTLGYDANNNLTSVQLPTGATTSAVYGTVSNIPYFYVPTSSTDAQGNRTTYATDGNGNVKTVTDALASQNQASYSYNGDGTVASATDFTGATTSYSYDSAGNLTKITPPSPMGATTIVPDSLSRVQSVTDGKGQQRSYSYDSLDRATALSYPAYGAGNVTWVFDNDGNATSMTDSTGTTTYQYDARNRQTQKTLPSSLGAGGFAYGFDPASNLTSMTDSASVPGTPMTVSYGYNAANLATSLVDPSGTTTFAYDPNQQRTSTTFPDGVVQSQSYDNSGRLSSIAGKASGTTLTSFAYSYTKPGGGDTLLPWGVTETYTGPNNQTTTNAAVANTYDALNRAVEWEVTNSGTQAIAHNYFYQYDGASDRTQIVADPLNQQGTIADTLAHAVAHSNENDLSFNAPNELSQIVAYGGAGTNPATTLYSYDQAGNQTGNNGDGTGKPLTIAYSPTNQTQSISDANQNPETDTWAGAGQAERVKRTWTDQGTNYAATYAWSLLGLSGYSNNGIGEPGPTSPVASWIVRAPDGAPIAQRDTNGHEYYYLLDGQGNVAALEDPGVVQAAYDYCPTGNNPELPATPQTTVGLQNPLRQGSQPYDEPTDMYHTANGVVAPSYSGVGTQAPAFRFGDALAQGAARFGTDRLVGPPGGVLLADAQGCDNANPDASSADQQGCDVTQETSGAASASAGGGAGEQGPGEFVTLPRQAPPDLQAGTTTPWNPQEYQGPGEQGPVPSAQFPWWVNAIIVAERILRILRGG